MGDGGPRDILWRPSLAADLARYALAVLFVTVTAGAATLAFHHLPDGEVASEVEDAVILDLPPALASSAPTGEATEGPEQQAAEAKPPEVAPEAKPEDPPPPVGAKSDIAPPPAVEKQPDAPPPPPAAASAAQEEMVPAGSQAPIKDAEPIDGEAARHRAARAMSRWQRAMLDRLEGAKSGARSGGEAGMVKVAFTIDHRGRLLSSRVVHSSGSLHLDQVALALLERAAPFSDPPAGPHGDLSFTVPIAFAHRR